MIKITKLSLLAVVMLTTLCMLNCSQSAPSLTDDEVLVAAGQLDIRFARIKPFSSTYLLFGGAENNHSNSFTKITLFGLEQNKAKFIHARYPDFYKCKSPGAPIAQKECCQLDIVPADSKVLKNLKRSLAEFDKSIKNDGDRVCVRLEGEVLKLTSALLREMNEDITKELPPQAHKEYFFVTSAQVLKFQEALMSP
ncbi:MAG: hypothetical protein ABIA59_06255 [Candidatus Latescibacterota bacterium]